MQFFRSDGSTFDYYLYFLLSTPESENTNNRASFPNLLLDTLTVTECTVTYLLTPSGELAEMLHDPVLSNYSNGGLITSARYILSNNSYTDVHSLVGGGTIAFQNNNADKAILTALRAPADFVKNFAPEMPVGLFLVFLMFAVGVISKIFKLFS